MSCMSVIYDYFSAASDQEALKVLDVDGGPTAADAGFDAGTLGGIDPVVQLGTLEALLTDTPYDEVTDDSRAGHNLAMSDDYDRIVITVTDALVAALAAADEVRLAEVAEPWSQTEELEGADPAQLAAFARDLAALARRATASGHRLYCWACI